MTTTSDQRQDVVLPEPIIRGSESSRCIDDIMRTREPRYEHLFMPGQEQLGHYYLPPFQRPAVWSTEQSARLVESLFLGISIGSIVVSQCRNTTKRVIDGEMVERFPDDSDWIIDGQQRMRAIRSYLANELTVFVGTPHEHRFNDLSQRQQRRFEMTNVGFITLGETDEGELRKIYDLMNFGGTAHTADQKASPST